MKYFIFCWQSIQKRQNMYISLFTLPQGDILDPIDVKNGNIIKRYYSNNCMLLNLPPSEV